MAGTAVIGLPRGALPEDGACVKNVGGRLAGIGDLEIWKNYYTKSGRGARVVAILGGFFLEFVAKFFFDGKNFLQSRALALLSRSQPLAVGA